MFIYLLNHPEFSKFDTSSLRGGLISGAPCPEALCHRLVNDLGLKDLQVRTREFLGMKFIALLWHDGV